MTADEMQEFLTANNARIKEAAVEAVIMRIRENVRYGLPDEVQKIVADFMRDEVAPAVLVALKSEKDGIVAAAGRAAAEIGNALAETMVAQAVKSMNGSGGSDIMLKLFRGY